MTERVYGDASAVSRLPVGVALRVFLPFALGYFMSYMFRTVNSVIAPELVADVGLTAGNLGLLTSVFFLSFGLFQLPLGMLLDRFGPRRVEAMLMLLAAVGAALFSLAPSLGLLALARALIGLGVSACMMAGFKAFVLWFDPHRLPLVNACLLAVGATGAVAATEPVHLALAFVDWRAVFGVLAGGTVLISAALLWVAPEHEQPPAHIDFSSQLRGLGKIFRDPYFWRIAPLTMFSQAAFLSVQGLWSGPWLRDVGRLDRAGVAGYLMALSGAIIAGFLITGTLSDRLIHRGVKPVTIAAWGMGLFLGVQCILTLGGAHGVLAVWIAFGLFGTSGTLPYAVLSQHFDRHLAGRVNTALNVLVFVMAFFTQWGMGVIIHRWENPITHFYDPTGYRVAFGLLVACQLLGFWLYLKPGRPSRSG